MAEGRTIIERGPGFASGLADLGKAINSNTITMAVVSGIFNASVVFIILESAESVGFDFRAQVSWVFGNFVMGGLIGIILSLYYKKPICGAWSMPGVAMMATALMGFTLNEAVFGFIVAGIIVFFLGITGLINKVMRWIPLPIVMGMIGGVLMRFGIGMVNATRAEPIVGIAAILGYFVVPKYIKRFPPAVAALVLGFVALLLTGGMNIEGAIFAYTPPQLVVPHFNPQVILAVSIPLAALVVGAENAQAIGILFTQKYDPPINAMTTISGIGGMLAGTMGAHNANIAGPMTAMCSSDAAGEREYRYGASMMNGILAIAFGAAASYVIVFVDAIPGGLISVMAGLALTNVLISAFKEGFSTGKFRVGVFIALATGLSGFTLFGIGAPFWSLVFGVTFALIVDSEDFKQERAA